MPKSILIYFYFFVYFLIKCFSLTSCGLSVFECIAFSVFLFKIESIAGCEQKIKNETMRDGLKMGIRIPFFFGRLEIYYKNQYIQTLIVEVRSRGCVRLLSMSLCERKRWKEKNKLKDHKH